MDLGRQHAAAVEVRAGAFAMVVAGLVSACAPAVTPPPAAAAPRPESVAHDDESVRVGAARVPEEGADPAPVARPSVRPGPSFGELPGWTADDHQAARDAFRRSCAVTTSRTDNSGLTEPNDWRDACVAAEATGPAR